VTTQLQLINISHAGNYPHCLDTYHKVLEYCGFSAFLNLNLGLSCKSKLKLYWTLIRPVVTYACEKWVLKGNSIQKLMIFERKILRKIFGPTKEENGLWRIKTNEELDELIKRKNIIRFIKSQRLKWLG